MYAIVDIETTGGYASANGITEIAIALHDGERLVDFFETLVNPLVPIPPYIQSLTGITPAMVSQAPLFDEVAPTIFEMLQGNVFVAHNVNFDYSFVKHHLAAAGFDLDTKKLCTVRLGRKVLPGYPSYSLGNICRSLNIEVENRHRAAGDTLATVRLFEYIVANDHQGEIQNMLKGKAKEQFLPPNLPVDQVAGLPKEPGVYYFHNKKGKIIYVGKARNLRKRVTSHFSNNKTGRQKQEFLREIYKITYQVCGSELMAFILESIEIKRLWPYYNRSQKGYEQAYGLYSYEDGLGFTRLLIEKKKKHLQPLYTFNLLLEGHNLLKKLVEVHELCPRLCFLDTTPGPSLPQQHQIDAVTYNQRVQHAVASLHDALPTFAVVEDVTTPGTNHSKGFVLVEKGRFFGMGYVDGATNVSTIDQLKPLLTQYPENGYIRGLVMQYASKFPHRMMAFSG